MEKTRRSGIRLSRPQRRIISTTAGPVVTDARKRGEERRPKNYGRTGASPYIQMNKAACARARPFSLLREKRDPERSVLSIPRLSLRIQHARRHSSKKRTRPGSAREARTGTCCDRHHSPDAFLDIAASTIQLGRFPAHLLKYTVLNEPGARHCFCSITYIFCNLHRNDEKIKKTMGLNPFFVAVSTVFQPPRPAGDTGTKPAVRHCRGGVRISASPRMPQGWHSLKSLAVILP